MMRFILPYLFLAATTVLASLTQDTLQQLQSTDLAVRDSALQQLQVIGAEAGRPGAEGERMAFCLEVCAALENELPEYTARYLLKALERIGGEESVRTLAKQLNGPDPHLREYARAALIQNPSPMAGQVIMERLKTAADLPPRETAGLIYALGIRQEKEAVDIVTGYLQSPEDLVFTASVKTLVRIGNRDSLRMLAELRKKAEASRKKQLTEALISTGEPGILKSFYSSDENEQLRALAMLGLLVNGHLEPLADMAGSRSPRLCAALIEAAGRTQQPQLLDWIVVHMDKLPMLLQVQALGVLEFSDAPRYARQVEPFLSDAEPRVSQTAAEALGRIGRKESVQPLLHLGTPPALHALAMLHAEGVDDALEAAMEDETFRPRAIRTLAQRGRSDLMQTYFDYAAQDNRENAKAGLAAIALLGDAQSLDPLASLLAEHASSPLSRPIQEAMIAILRRCAEPEQAISVLTKQMESVSLRGKAGLLQVLAEVGSPDTLQPILKACRSSDETLRKTAIKLLGGWESPEVVPELLKLAGDPCIPLADHVVLMRGVSRILAGQKPEKRSAEQLFEALETCRRPDEKRALLPMLIEVESPKAEEVLQQYLSDPELGPIAEEILSAPKNEKK